MLVVSSLDPQVLTFEERWCRWERRGQDNDVRLMRRMRGVVWSAVVVITVVLLFALLY